MTPPDDAPKEPQEPRDTVRQPSSQDDELIAFLEPVEGEVHTDGDGGSYVQLDAPIADQVRAQLVDLCIQGASVMVARKEMPFVEPGSVLGLRIEHPREGWAVSAKAIVRSVRGTVRIRLGLEFPDESLADKLVEGAGRYFNRRRGTRVELSNQRIEVRMNFGGVILPAQACDLSVYGVAVRLPLRWSRPLRDLEKGTASILLPDVGGPVDCPIHVTRRQEMSSDEHGVATLGLAFDVRGGSRDAAKAKRIESFVEGYLARRLRWAS